MFGTFELNITQPVNQQIYRVLRKAIITCNILPGSSLSEKDISSQFNVSRQPVREAFIKLAEAGLVQILPQRGTFVTKISAKKVIDAQFIREAVECAIIQRVAVQAKKDDIDLIQKNLDEQMRAVECNDVLCFLEKDDEFHQILMSIIDCSIAWETLENIKAMMDRVRFLSFEIATPPGILIRQHEKIFNAIKEHDSEKAASAQREHLRGILSSITIVAQNNTDWFVD